MDSGNLRNYVAFEEDFLGAMTLGTTAHQGSRFIIADTSAAGTPTYTVGGINGEATLDLDTQAEAENVCLYMGDVLNFDIDSIYEIRMFVKQGQATIDSASSIAFGLGSARNDDPDAIAAHAHFRLIGSNSVVVESDDGVNDNDDVATGQVLADSYKEFKINFAGGTSDVKFYIDGAQVAKGTTFNMSSYSAGLQPYLQIQKTLDSNGDSVVLDYVIIECKRV